MVAPLRTTSISAPGFYGLNTMDSEVTLNQGYARSAENCIIDEGGRLGSRLGWTYTYQTNPVSAVNLKGMHRFLDIDGLDYFGAWSDTGFYVENPRGSKTLTSVTYNGGNTLTDGNWQAATLNDAAFLFQRGYNPIYFSPTTGVLDDVVNATHTAAVSASNGTTVTITHSGTVATVTHASHKLTSGDTVIISGADQSNYNGTFTVTVTGTNTYQYTMSNSPSVDATGTITARTKIAVITHTGHDILTGDTVIISGASATAYNGTWTVTVLDSSSYYYTMSSVPTADDGSTIADWYKGTPPQAHTVLSAYGRLWCADTPTNKTTVYWSDLLDGAEWRTNVGTVGSLDISSILVYGNDEIVGLGAHNGRLIIFCKNNIIIMDDQSAGKQYLDPADMALVEVINGVGCVARDSIVNTGTDIMFLSESGVRGLSRTIQEKSQPMRDISRNVRDTLVDQVARADKDQIKAVYSDHFAFYLLTIPDEKTVWCFDMRAPLENGAARVTRWNNLDHTHWLAFDGQMFMTNVNGIAEYTGYQDNGDKYSMQYYTNYFDFEMPNIVKIVKNIAATVIGSTGQKFVAKLGTDYEDIYTSYNLTVKQAANFEYNIAGYGLSNTVQTAPQAATTVTVEWAQPTITGATQANPCVITSPAHGLTNGDEVFIDNVGGMTQLNGNKYIVNVITANDFELVGVDSTAYTAYTSGGDLTHLDSYTVDFDTVVGATYNTAYKVWLDPDGFYYANNTLGKTRTKTILYTKGVDWASEYSGASLIDNIRIPAGNSGFVIQLGFESEIDGGYLNIQQIDLYAKQGRLN
jgi:hypothetical protein